MCERSDTHCECLRPLADEEVDRSRISGYSQEAQDDKQKPVTVVQLERLAGQVNLDTGVS